MTFSAVIKSLAFAAILLPAAAWAQTAPQTGGPGVVTDNKAVGDWTVRCFAVGGPSPCDMYQELDNKDTHQRVLSISIAYVPGQDRNVGQIAVPLGIAIASGIVIKADNYTSQALPYRRCDQAGCYVELVLGNDIVDSLGKGGANGSMNIKSDDGKSYALRFSLNGFSAAHDAMAGLAKQKATAAPAAAGAAAPAPAAPPAKK